MPDALENPSPRTIITMLREMERRALATSAQGRGLEDGQALWHGVVFELAGQPLVAAMDEVREVLNFPGNMTRVPAIQPWLRGVINLRGDLVAVTDLQAFFGAGLTTIGRRSRLLVIKGEEADAAMLVGTLVGMRHFAPFEAREPMPDSLPALMAPFVTGAFGRGEQLWPVFRFASLLQSPAFLAVVQPGRS